MEWNEQLNTISGSLPHIIPELILFISILLFVFLGLFKIRNALHALICIVVLSASCGALIQQGFNNPISLFNGFLRIEGFGTYIKFLIDIAGIFTCLMSFRKNNSHVPEFFAVLLTVVVGGHILAMTTNALMIFLSMETLSISSYILAGYAFNKPGSEGSLKYFLFGSVASAVLLYGFSMLYGITGILDFSTEEFFNQVLANNSPLVLTASFMVLAGFLYKISAAPMHLWVPDVYEGAPIPVIAFLSVAPKLAGLTVLTKFVLSLSLFGQSVYDWQIIISGIAILTITVGNFSALRQQNSKRLMAYSSIAQSGFLLIGVAAFLAQGLHFMLFYASIYLLMNFLVFLYLEYFEIRGVKSIAEFSGKGKVFLWPSVFLLVGLISLTGLPPTAGFTGKLFIFSSLWQSYETSGQPVLIVLLVFGLVNTVISLFYYLRIPYFAFLKSGEPAEKPNLITFENLFGLILVLLILLLFFMPGLLMSWINKINFVF